ncbi:hypothetical protein EON65_53105 [archaeon]|nr:MAG: hypothetical protein EON65_53105 [archaeon]
MCYVRYDGGGSWMIIPYADTTITLSLSAAPTIGALRATCKRLSYTIAGTRVTLKRQRFIPNTVISGEAP